MTKGLVCRDGDLYSYEEDLIKVKYHLRIEFVDKDGRNNVCEMGDPRQEGKHLVKMHRFRCEINDMAARVIQNAEKFWDPDTPADVPRE